MKKCIVITGASGFIGSEIAYEFIARGDQVVALVRRDSNLSRIKRLNGVVILIFENFCDLKIIKKLQEISPDAFIHCAWRGVAGCERNAKFQISENIPNTLSSVDLAAAVGCRKWIGLGSQAEYGNANCKLDENAQTLPTTLYGKAKLAAGISGLALCEANGISGNWMRIFSTYGPGDNPAWFIPYVSQELLAERPPLLTSCEQLWDYLYITDAARAVIAMTDCSDSGVFNLGAGLAKPLREYVEAICMELKSRVQPVYGAIPYRIDQVMHLEADISKIQSSTGWRPSTSFEQGIKLTLAQERLR